MKKVEVYQGVNLKLSLIVDECEIDSYSESIEITCKIGEIETSFTIPVNKDYKLFVEV